MLQQDIGKFGICRDSSPSPWEMQHTFTQ